MMWVTSPLYVRILDQYDNVVASNSYTTNGSYSLSFTPSTSGSTYKIQLYMPNAVSQCMYSLDNISISYYEVDTDIVCENVPLGYRYGFNGMEKDDEAKGKGNSYDFGARMFDPRIGRWLSRDKKEYKMPDHSPYVFVNNDPIRYIDPDGNFLIDVHKRIMRKAFKRSKLGESVEYTHVDVGIYRRTLVGTGGQITHSPKVRHHGSVIEPDVKSLPKVMGGGGQESIDEEHFDNMNSSQIQKNYNDVYSSMIAAVDSYSAGEIDAHELGNKVGPYFHALQDLYSHSNYIELYEEMYGKTDVNLIPTYGEVLSESKYADFKQLLTDKLHSGHYPGKGEGSHREMNHDLGEGSAFDFLPEVKDKKVNWNSKAAEAVATKSSTYMNDIIEGKMTQKK
jgi:RHS repeat-associated protein